jgi:AraC family transcriptional regulator of adaptative response / DNA-3-methyladenine glycosylase II
MDSARQRLYRALSARDARFDGIFFVGVTSTGVYCRPICPARTPKPANCRFFDSPQQAEYAGFRPCLRCRPELAPGSAPVDDGQRIAQSIVERLEDGRLDAQGLETIAGQFELSSRQIRRIVRQHLGVPPMQLLLTRRLLLAKQLLTETDMPVIDVAFASGFSSLRRFNDAFVTRYSMPPTRLRKAAVEESDGRLSRTSSTLRLSYRPPYDWDAMLAFLSARALPGVEEVANGAYARTVRLGGTTGWVVVRHARTSRALVLEFAQSLTPVLPALLRRIRALFDLDARPDVIARTLARDTHIGAAVRAHRGVRVPGSFDGFELGLRAIVGQQVSVKAATTIAGRLVDAFGEPVVTPFDGLNRLTPTASHIASKGVEALAGHGLIPARAATLIALAASHVSGALDLDARAHHRPEETIARLMDLPGIGPWTAHYIAMRALRWPDAFPKEDLAVRRSLGGVSADQAESLSQAWRPWRSYAVMHAWMMSGAVRTGSSGRRGTHAKIRA